MDNIRVLDASDPGVTAEQNWGNANHHALPPAERRKRAKRKSERARRWAQAEAVRATWTPEDFAEEEARIAAQIAEWEKQRNAA
ncbi:PIN domain-containing protein [Sulfitobacter dubius]|uniref:hypothetical protein n=1 Tax=Sulfitobacter dubius TaxID=218673 RepID=UPI00294391C1|nr:hypothetical protein [Sulfitobacter dubius]WOI29128.1 hypothetical protein R1T39_15825 [Sulfitobacter dubius]